MRAMSAVMAILAALLGWLVGGVVNLLADDLPPLGEAEGVGPVRSPHCPRCGAARPGLRALALVRLATGGRCSACGAPDGWRPAIVEAAFALVFAALTFWAQGDPLTFLLGAVVVSVYGLICVIDIEHRLILWRTVWVSALALVAVGLLRPDMGWQKSLLGGVIGFVLVFGLFLLGQAYGRWVARRRGEPLDEVAFGGGDVNLAALVGLTVGWPGVLVALFIGIAVGGVFAIGLIAVQLLRGRYDPHQPIAYGPFLASGALALFFFAPAIRGWFGAA